MLTSSPRRHFSSACRCGPRARSDRLDDGRASLSIGAPRLRKRTRTHAGGSLVVDRSRRLNERDDGGSAMPATPVSDLHREVEREQTQFGAEAGLRRPSTALRERRHSWRIWRRVSIDFLARERALEPQECPSGVPRYQLEHRPGSGSTSRAEPASTRGQSVARGPCSPQASQRVQHAHTPKTRRA